MLEFKVPRSVSIQCNICKLADFPTNKSMMDIIWRFHGPKTNWEYAPCMEPVYCAGGVYRREDRWYLWCIDIILIHGFVRIMTTSKLGEGSLCQGGGGSLQGVTANLLKAALLIILILCSKLNHLIMCSYIQQLLQDFNSNSISWRSYLTLNRFLRFLAHVHKIFA